MSVAVHRIRRQVWRVKAPTRETAFAMRMQLRARVDTELPAAFERAFDALGAGEDVVRIPRLELELRLPSGDRDPGAIARLLVERLGEALHDWAAKRPEEVRTNRLAPAQSRHRMLLHYLAQGHVEWHAGADSSQAIAAALREEARMLAREPGAFRDLLRGPLAQRMAASFRLLQLLDPDERTALLAQAPLHEIARPRTTLASRLLALASPAQRAGYALLRVQALALAWNAADERDATQPRFASLLRECLGESAPRGDGGEAAWRAEGGEAGARADSREAVPRKDGGGQLRTAESVPSAGRREAVDMDARVDESRGEMPSSPIVARAEARMETMPAAVPESGEGVLAHDAGLVLLHPYLERLFDAAGIARDEAGNIAEGALPRAAALLHWLLAGRDDVHEFELAAIKVLLGLAPESAVLAAPGLLEESDRAEADALLAAAISHWPVLGATGIDGLRRTFLQRRGLLRDLGRAWSLQVEPAAFDVLLGSLPWAFNIVKLPWMTRPIFIEWPTP